MSVQKLLSLAFLLAHQIGSTVLLWRMGAWGFHGRVAPHNLEFELEQEPLVFSHGNRHTIPDDALEARFNTGKSWHWG
jgi:hypothetical protein